MKKSGFEKSRRGFLKVKCKCGNEQVLFSAASRTVKCLKCDSVLSEPGASNAIMQAKVIGEFE